MELDELKTLWQKDSKRLQQSLILNKKLLKKGTISKFEKHRWFMTFGRNMALVYAGISIVLAIYFYNLYIYNIPLLIGAFAMIWSFKSHLAIGGKADYQALSILDLQKKIHNFKIHIRKNKYYDGLVVAFWFLTVTPPYLKYSSGYDIYSSIPNLPYTIGVALLSTIAFAYICHKLYEWTDSDMEDAVNNLEEILLFEDSDF